MWAGTRCIFVAWIAAVLTATANGGEAQPEKARAKMPSALDRVPAYHYRRVFYAGFGSAESPPKIERVEEVWALRGAGRRVENRVEGKLTGVSVESSRWRFVWNLRQNHVAAWPSDTEGHLENQDTALVQTRQEMIRLAQRLKATYVSEKEHRDGKELEKISFRCLADPAENFAWPIHRYVAEIHDKLLQSPAAKFRSRTWWFDPKTGLTVGYKCGCKSSKAEYWVDYPAPESLSPELFTFRVPRDATLEINDPALGRQVHSEGHKGPDLRQ